MTKRHLQVQVFYCLLDDNVQLGRANAFDQSVELDGLLDGELREDSIVLGAVANELPSILELRLYVKSLNRDLTGRWSDLSRQTLERR